MILAPIFEELLFRGFIQHGLGGYEKRSGWILAGLLFGLLHLGNHISNAIAAVFIGLLLSYLAYATGSIVPTIIVHGVVNGLSAILIHIPAFFDFSVPAIWIINPVMLLISLIILIHIVRQMPKVQVEEPSKVRYGFKSFSVLIICLLILSSFAVTEVFYRLNSTSLAMTTSTIKAGLIEQRMMLASIDIPEKADLLIVYDIKAEEISGELIIENQAGELVWSLPIGQAKDITLYNQDTVKELKPDTYELALLGSATNLEVSLQWQLVK